MPLVVRTSSTIAVSPPSGGGPGHRVPLSAFDARWVALPPVCHVLLFPAPSPPVPFSDVVRALRYSLAVVLRAFHPFAGELVYSPESRTVAIVCGEDAGVAFVEAETDLEFSRLADRGAEHDVHALRQLVPDIGRDELPAPVMAAQVTEFVGGGGGIAVGLTVHHAAADGSGFWRFLEMWAAAAAGAQKGRVSRQPAPPLHDRSLVAFDGDRELAGAFLRLVAPDLPRVSRYTPKVAPKQDPSLQHGTLPIRRTFTFAASAVRRMKQRLAAATGVAGVAPSTFAAMAAHGWVSVARARGLADDGPVFAVFLTDCRAHMSPPVPDTFAGNCVATCVVQLSAAELTGPDGPVHAFMAIRDAVAEAKRDPLGDRRRWISRVRAIPPGRAVVLVGSPWLPAFAVDFGFGLPARSEHVSMNYDGEMVLHAGREAGSVQVSVLIAATKMPAFCELFTVDAFMQFFGRCQEVVAKL